MPETPKLGINQILGSYDNPRGDAGTEQVMRTFNEGGTVAELI